MSVHARLEVAGHDRPICASLRERLQRDPSYGLGDLPAATSLWSEVTCGWCRPLVEYLLEQGLVGVDDRGHLVITPGD